MSRARLGVIGAGFWASYNYLPYFRDDPGVDLVGVVRKTEDGLDEFRREFGLEVATTLRRRAPRRRRRRGRRHVAARIPSRACGRGARGRRPRARREADDRQARRRRGDPGRGAASGKTAAVAYGWNYSRLAIWAKEMLEAGRIGRVTSVTGYKSSCLTELFSGRAGYGSWTSAASTVEVEVETWARADAGGGYLYGQLSHLLGLGLWLAPAEPEDVFARASFLENGCDLDVHASVRLADGVIATFNGQGHQPWVMRHMPATSASPARRACSSSTSSASAASCCCRATASGARCCTSGSSRRCGTRRGSTRATGRAQFLIDTLPRPGPGRPGAGGARRPHRRRDGGGVAVGSIRAEIVRIARLVARPRDAIFAPAPRGSPSTLRSTCRCVGFVRRSRDATGYGRSGSRPPPSRSSRTGSRRRLRRRHRRDRRAGDLRPPRPGRGGDRRRPGRDPPQLEPHAPLRDRRLLGRRADRGRPSRSATRGSGRSPT